MTIMDTERDNSVLDTSLASSFYAKYEVKEVLGTGASSSVRRCIDKKTKVEFAVKIIDLNSGVDSPDVIRSEVMREVGLLRRVAGHQNIIVMHDAYEGDAYVFLVFEVCKGGELFDYLTHKVTVSQKRTRVFMRQLFDAVAFIHSKGIVHRDLKPENILLDSDLTIKVTDFGLAVSVDNTEELYEIRGTPGYLAPEVLMVGYYDDKPPYGQPVDMWACGVIMYTLLAGCPPFWNRKEYLMLRQIMEGKYSFPSPEWDDISEAAKDLIRRLLVVDVNSRITASEVLKHEFFAQQTVRDPLVKETYAHFNRDQPLRLPSAPWIHTVAKKHEDLNRKKSYFKVPGISPHKIPSPTQPTPQAFAAPIVFNARRKFKAGAMAVGFTYYLRRLKACGGQLYASQLAEDPYANRRLRKIIDALSYDVYSQWVKKGEDQNRAALFENAPRRDLVEPVAGEQDRDNGFDLQTTLKYAGLHLPDVNPFDFDYDDESLRAPIRVDY